MKKDLYKLKVSKGKSTSLPLSEILNALCVVLVEFKLNSSRLVLIWLKRKSRIPSSPI